MCSSPGAASQAATAPPAGDVVRQVPADDGIARPGVRSRWSFVVIVSGVGVAELPDGTGRQVGKGETVGPVDTEVPADKRRQPDYVLIAHRVALGLSWRTAASR